MTCREIIESVYPQHAKRIIELSSDEYLDQEEEEDDTAFWALVGAFNFDETPEGHAYWWQLAESTR